MNSRRTPADEVFVVRFWREQQDSGTEFRWRVQVRSVTTNLVAPTFAPLVV